MFLFCFLFLVGVCVCVCVCMCVCVCVFSRNIIFLNIWGELELSLKAVLQTG